MESLALHTAEGETSFDVPTGISAISRIYARTSIKSLLIHSCDAAWDFSVDADFTVTADSTIKRQGSASVKFGVAGTVSDGDTVTDDFTALDISDKTHIEFWVRVNAAVAANDLVLRVGLVVGPPVGVQDG